MKTNLVKKVRQIIRILNFSALFVFLHLDLHAQNCPSELDFVFTPSGAGQGVNWSQFPEFSLPFKIVYGGPGSIYRPYELSRRGFTHFSNPNSYSNIPTKNRAFIFTNVVLASPNQPWYLERNPWGNDMKAYERYWDEWIRNIKSAGQTPNELDIDLLVFDVERQLKSDAEILLLKKSNFTPASVKTLSDADFILSYKKELQTLYTSAAVYFRKNGLINPQKTKVSYYADSPIYNTFINIQGRTWDKWKSDKTAINYLCYDFSKNKVGGSLYDQQDFLTPSAYFYYDYPHPFAGEYLSYLLFQIEANRELSAKEQMVFLWQRYSFNPDYVGRPIRPWMAESMAIFPFFAGAKGLWIWEDPASISGSSDLSNYEYIMKGMYRLSKFSDMFSGNFDLIETTSARDYNENKQPIWRGVKKGNTILIAAHNPWAKTASEEVQITVKYKNWTRKITLKGYETHLCKYNLDDNLVEIDFSNLQIFPNPSSDFLQIKASLNADTNGEINIYDMAGRKLKTEQVKISKGIYSKMLDIKGIIENIVLVELKTPNQRVAQKIILN